MSLNFFKNFEFHPINSSYMSSIAELQEQIKYHMIKSVRGHFNKIYMSLIFFEKFKFHIKPIREKISSDLEL